MIPTTADLREHEAHRDHPAPLTGRCGIGACRRTVDALDRAALELFAYSRVNHGPGDEDRS